MKKHLNLLFASVLFLKLSVSFYSSYSQIPQAIPYQAVARNSNGNLIVNQSISIRFSLHNITATGAIIYQEKHTSSTNSLGLFNVYIGQGIPLIGNFSSINWANNSKYLEVEIDPSGSVNYINLGTIQFMSVPYALYASASGPNGTSIGNTQHWNGNSWVADNALFNDGSNVGIGTSTPEAKLQIEGQVKITGGNAGEGKVLVSDNVGLASWQEAIGFQANTSDQPSLTNTAANYRIFGNVVWNYPNGSYNPLDGVFTAPTAGIYHFEYCQLWNGPPTSGGNVNMGFHIFNNLTSQSYDVALTKAVWTSTSSSNSGSVTVKLNANDQVRVVAYNLSPFTVVPYGISDYTNFSGFKVK